MNLMLAIQIVFWSSLLSVFWIYFGYLITLKVVSVLARRDVKKSDIYPEVSLVITAYNEERRIKEKLENTLALSYPTEKLEVIVVSDGSTDNTEEIVRSYRDKGVRLIALPERHGKHYGQGKGIEEARSDIIALTDATTFIQHDGIEKIVRNFADPEVGCVSSVDQMRSANANSSGEGIYVKYEMLLRELESATGSLVGVSGCFYAVRKHLCSQWIDNMSADFYLPIIARINGFRTVLEQEAISSYEVTPQPKKEFVRKVRTVSHGLEVLFRFRGILNPLRYGTYAFKILSHKLSRWLVPLFLFIFLIANIWLVNHHPLYLIVLALQLLFYFLALIGYSSHCFRQLTLFRIPLFFTMVNLSILVAWYYYFTGKEFVLWEPTKR